MGIMMVMFHNFAGNKGCLTKEDLRVLVEKEFPGFWKIKMTLWL